MSVTNDYTNLIGNKAENYWVGGILPDYHKFKIDSITTRFMNPVIYRRWIYQGGDKAPLTVNYERVPSARLYLWRDKFGNGFTGTASGADFYEVAQRRPVVYSGQRKPFYAVTTRFPRMGIDATMGDTLDLAKLMGGSITPKTWETAITKLGIDQKGYNLNKDIHNMDFVIGKHSGVTSGTDMFQISETYGKLDVYLHEFVSFDIVTTIKLRFFRRDE